MKLSFPRGGSKIIVRLLCIYISAAISLVCHLSKYLFTHLWNHLATLSVLLYILKPVYVKHKFYYVHLSKSMPSRSKFVKYSNSVSMHPAKSLRQFICSILCVIWIQFNKWLCKLLYSCKLYLLIRTGWSTSIKLDFN